MMNEFLGSFAYWLADFYLWSTILLATALAAIWFTKQPVKRMVIAKSVLVAIVLLAVLSALPRWSVVHLLARQINEPPTVQDLTTIDAPSEVIVGRLPSPVANAKGPVALLSLPAPPAAKFFGWTAPSPTTLCSLLYLSGSGCVLAWLGLGALAARRLVRDSRPAKSELSRLSARIVPASGRGFDLLVSDRIDVAVAIGVRRSAIVLPSRWVDDRSAEELQTVLAHEVAHVENGDLAWLAVGRALLVLLWAQPLYWLLRRSLRLDQEALADAAAAELSDRRRYAEQLVAWARDLSARPRQMVPAAMGLWEGPAQLRQRVAILLDERLTMLRRCPRVWMFSASAVALALAGILSTTTLEPSNFARAEQDAADSDTSARRDVRLLAAAKSESVADDEVAGIVIDETGEPLAGVSVDAWTWFSGNETSTDERGRFSLRGFNTREPVELQFTKSGFCPRLFIAQRVGMTGWVVTLNNRSYLEGRVLNPQGEPVADANIRATRGPFSSPGGGVIGAVWTEMDTEANGRYRMYLEPGTYELRVRQPGVGIVRYENTVVRENNRRKLDLQLEAGPIFRAHVIDSQTGEPVSGIRLFQWREPGIVGSSNEKGELEIANMLPGSYEFNVSADGEKSRFADVAGDFARWWSSDALKEWQRLDLTDGGKGFQRNFDDLEFDIREGMKPVTVVVERGVKIRGQVVDPDGQSVAGATVAPAKTGSGNSLTGDTRYSVRSAADGTFEMRLPASGAATYNLVAHDGDYEQWRTWANGIGELLQTKPGDIVENVKLQLSTPCVVRGRVQDASGQPVAKHRVLAQAADKRENRYYDPTTETNERGEFELRFVRPGKHYIQAEPFWLSVEEGPKDAWQLVVAQPDQPTEGVILTLPPATAESRSKFQVHVVLSPQAKDD